MKQVERSELIHLLLLLKHFRSLITTQQFAPFKKKNSPRLTAKLVFRFSICWSSHNFPSTRDSNLLKQSRYFDIIKCFVQQFILFQFQLFISVQAHISEENYSITLTQYVYGPDRLRQHFSYFKWASTFK